MKKVNAIFEGVIFLWIMLIVFITFLSMSLSGMCSQDWVCRNVVISSIAEIIFFVWIIVNIQRGASDVLKETKNLLVVKSLYKRVLVLSVIVIFYGLVTYSFSSEMFGCFVAVSDSEINPSRIYLENIVGVAIFFFLWMWIEIRKINKKMRF